MIVVERKEIHEIPLLEVCDVDLKSDKLPLVFFYHGWTSCKEQVLTQGFEIAKRGARVVLPDALYHGERQDDKDVEAHAAEFFKIVVNSINEFQKLKTAYTDKKLADDERVGVSGLSMGGITTCGLLRTRTDIKAADCLMGSPNMYEFANQMVEGFATTVHTLPDDVHEQLEFLKDYDLSLAPESIKGRAVHFWHGTEDKVVAYQPTYDFYQRIKHEPYAEKVTFTTTNHEHKVPYSISVEMGEFFEREL